MPERVERHPIAWTPERVGRLWEFYAGRPDAAADYFSAHSGRSVLDYLAHRVPLSGSRVLDFGCGRGDMLRHLLARGVSCQGLEFSEASAAAAREALGNAEGLVGVVHASGLPSPLPDAGFDVVMAVEVVEHLLEDQLPEVLGELRRLVRPGGHVLITTPHAENLEASLQLCPECGCTFHRWQHVRSFTPESLRGLLERAGFATLECRALQFRPHGSWGGRLLRHLQSAYHRLRGVPAPKPHLAWLGSPR